MDENSNVNSEDQIILIALQECDKDDFDIESMKKTLLTVFRCLS
jgi:hypothetical protein